MKSWHRSLVGGAIGIALLTGCSPEPSDVATATVTATVTAAPGGSAERSPTPSVDATPTSNDAWLPAELRGTWCNSDGTYCLSGGDLHSEYPTVRVESVSATPEVVGAVDYTFCLDDMDSDFCSVAASMYLRYFPAGVGWDCVAVEVVAQGWPGCSPDFSGRHDLSLPRLVVLPNHQQGTMYEDTEPLYLTTG